MAEDNQSEEISKYNEASLQIMRLNGLWIKAETAINEGRIIDWKFLLDSIWRELYADVLRLKDTEVVKKRNIFVRYQIAKSKTRDELYISLNARHEFLKGLQDSVGKGGIYQDGSESNFE